MSNLPEATTAFLQELKNTTSFLDIKNEIEKLQNIEITVLGETIIDKYTYGEALNKSSKNPTLVMNIKQNQIFAGGILAIANHLSTFVKKVNIITYLGELEEYKEFILSNLQQNINFYYIKKQHSPTIVKTRFIDSYYNQRLFETYDINQDLLSDVETDELIKLLPSKGNILIGDFGHGLINSHIIRHLYRKFSHICVNVQANAGNFGFNLLRKYYEGAYYSAIDLNELHLLMSDRTNNIETLIKELIKENWTPDYLSITTGKQGAQFFNRFNLQENYSSPAMTSSVIDTVGCGDQYFAITSLLMLNKCPHKYIPFIGCVGAAIKSKITGNSQFVSKNDLLQNIEILMK
jgi:bifunctional ADP-heptose synthase (sugar kinase/adenylyltransferase)